MTIIHKMGQLIILNKISIYNPKLIFLKTTIQNLINRNIKIQLLINKIQQKSISKGEGSLCRLANKNPICHQTNLTTTPMLHWTRTKKENFPYQQRKVLPNLRSIYFRRRGESQNSKTCWLKLAKFWNLLADHYLFSLRTTLAELHWRSLLSINFLNFSSSLLFCYLRF